MAEVVIAAVFSALAYLTIVNQPNLREWQFNVLVIGLAFELCFEKYSMSHVSSS